MNIESNFSDNNISVLLGDGLGSFATATHFTTGTLPYAIVSGDFNGDGKADLATANEVHILAQPEQSF